MASEGGESGGLNLICLSALCEQTDETCELDTENRILRACDRIQCRG